MEKAGEKPTEEEEIVGKGLITVYNDCFSIEHTSTLSINEVAGLFISALEKMGGETEERQVH